ESFTISNDPPIGEGGSEFARVEQVRIARRPSKCVAAGLEERFKNDKPRRADCRADCRRARSVKEIEDRYEVIGVRGDRGAGFEIGASERNRYAISLGEIGRAFQGIRQNVDGLDIETRERQMNGVTTGAAGQIEGAPAAEVVPRLRANGQSFNEQVV